VWAGTAYDALVAAAAVGGGRCPPVAGGQGVLGESPRVAHARPSAMFAVSADAGGEVGVGAESAPAATAATESGARATAGGGSEAGGSGAAAADGAAGPTPAGGQW